MDEYHIKQLVHQITDSASRNASLEQENAVLRGTVEAQEDEMTKLYERLKEADAKIEALEKAIDAVIEGWISAANALGEPTVSSEPSEPNIMHFDIETWVPDGSLTFRVEYEPLYVGCRAPQEARQKNWTAWIAELRAYNSQEPSADAIADLRHYGRGVSLSYPAYDLHGHDFRAMEQAFAQRAENIRTKDIP